MSNPMDTPAVPDPTPPNTTQEKPASFFGTVNDEVVNILKDRNSSVRTAVVEELVKEKIDQRIRMVARGISLIRDLRSKIQKTKGTPVYDGDGKVIQEGFTKDQISDKKRCTDNITALEGALKKAHDDAEYGQLEKAISKAEKTLKGEKDDGNGD